MKEKAIIGLTEEIVIYSKDGDEVVIKARIDTGATKSSIDTKLAAELQLGPVVETKTVKSVHGTGVRAIVEGKIRLADKDIITQFTIADRSHMKFPVLIGQNALKNGFLIDPSKK